MKKRLMVCLIVLLSCMSLSAQEATPEALFRTRLAADSILLESFADGNVDYGIFGRYARDTARYHALKSRFEACDTTLFGSDLLILYYGPAFREDYDGGYGQQAWEGLYSAGKFAEAYPSIIRELQSTPASPRLLLCALRSAIRAGRDYRECSAYGWQLSQVLGWIGFLGDGSKTHPIAVVTVLDEYAYVDWVLGGAKVESQSLVLNDGRYCDCLKLDDGESEIWFDISLPFGANTAKWKNRLETGR